MCLPTSHLPCQSEACSAPADGDRLPARAPKDMDNLLKIVVSESSVVQLDGLLEKERAVADKITHELLVLASDAVHGRQWTSGAFPSSGRGNFKLLAHLVARAVGGWLDEDINSDQAIALKIGKRLDAQVHAVRAALAHIAGKAKAARSCEMHRAHAASTADAVLALPAALAAAEGATAKEYHLQQTEIYFGFNELMRRNVMPLIVAGAPTPNADRRNEQAAQERHDARGARDAEFDAEAAGWHEDLATVYRAGKFAATHQPCQRCSHFVKEIEHLEQQYEIEQVDALRIENTSLKRECAELAEYEKGALAVADDLRARVEQLEQELHWSKGREDALRDLLRDNFVLKPAAPAQRAAMTAAYESIPKYGSTAR